ncbi:MAG TPA: DUF3383 domain-containing protein [Steroidobacteraceae bacterium]|nr:DUF3383 domain-containing protein [Steroidobacteraceae bacterium]
MQPSIPASAFVDVIPSVLAAGAPDLTMSAVFLDNSGDTSIPIGTVQEFPSYAAVAAWFGANSIEAQMANVYFAGYNGCEVLPTQLFFVQYNTAAVGAYIRGGALTGLTLTQLQAFNGVLTITIDGVNHVSANINLATATSFTNAAALIQAGLLAGTPSSAATCTYDALRNAFVVKSSTTGGASTIAFPTTDAFVTNLLLTQATGAVLSQGAAAAVPATLMNSIVAQTTDWATFTTVQDPDAGAEGGPIKQAFATWNAGQNASYLYVAYDSAATPSNGADPACFAELVDSLTGTDPLWSATQGALVAAFHCSIPASINYQAAGGRTTFAYRSSPVLSPDITSLTVYQNLKANQYNAYCDVATRTAAFQWLQPGQVSGAWAWLDSYINQIYWNSVFQNDFAELLSQTPAIPYTAAGYNLIREALNPDIQAMGAFGAWVPGVELSGSQQVAVNTAAGLTIAPILQSQGWYLQITDPGAAARATRSSPIVTFWYCDGGSIQQINMASIDVE